MAKQNESELDKLERQVKEGNKAKKELGEAEQKKKSLARKVDDFKKAQGRAIVFGHLGGAGANTFVELWNWPVRKLCEWAGWDIADLLQSIPHALIGEAIWITSLVLRGDAPASRLNEYFASHGFAQAAIGWNNLINAIRARWGEGRDEVKQLKAQIEILRRQAGQ